MHCIAADGPDPHDPAEVGERDVASNASNKESGHTALDHSKDEMRSKARNLEECQDQGAVAKQPQEAFPERVPGDGHVGEDTIQSGKSRGEYLSPGTLARVEPY